MANTTLRSLFKEVETQTQQTSSTSLSDPPSTTVPQSNSSPLQVPTRHALRKQKIDESFDFAFGEFVARSPAKNLGMWGQARSLTPRPLFQREENKSSPVKPSRREIPLQKQPAYVNLKKENRPNANDKTPRAVAVKPKKTPSRRKQLPLPSSVLDVQGELEGPAPSIEEIKQQIQEKNLITSTNLAIKRPSKKSKSLGMREILRNAELSCKKTETVQATPRPEDIVELDAATAVRLRTGKSRSISSADLESFEKEETKRERKARELHHSAVVPTKADLIGTSGGTGGGTPDAAVEKEARLKAKREKISASRRRRRSQSVDFSSAKQQGKGKRRQRRRNSLKRGFKFAKELFSPAPAKSELQQHEASENEESEDKVAQRQEMEADKDQEKEKEKEDSGTHATVGEEQQDEEPKAEKRVPAGTMNGIVGFLIEQNISSEGGVVDMLLLVQFLLAYRQWMTAKDLFNTLLERYHFPTESTPLKRGTRDLQHERKVALPTRQKIVTFLEEWIKVSYEVDFKSDPELVGRVIKFLNKRIIRDGISRRSHEANKKIWMQSSNATKERALGSLTPLHEDSGIDDEINAESTNNRSAAGSVPLQDTDEKAVMGTGSRASRMLVGAAPTEKTEKLRPIVAGPHGSRVQRLRSEPLEAPPSPHSPAALSRKVGLSMKTEESNSYKSINFWTVTVSALAEQMSRIDFGLFQKIGTTEFNHLAFGKAGKEMDSPNVTLISERFNTVSYWVATLIIIGTRDRVKTVEKFVKLCKKLIKLGNYASFFAVLAGLEIHSVSRLKCVWRGVSPKRKLLHEKHNKLACPNKNYHAYRMEFKKRYDKLPNFWEVDDEMRKKIATKKTSPIIPFLGVMTRDFTFADTGNVDYLHGNNNRTGIINPEKLHSWGSYLLAMKNVQAQVCYIKPNYGVANWLSNLYYQEESVLDQHSNAMMVMSRRGM